MDDDDAPSTNSVKNFWHHLKKLGNEKAEHVTEEIISMVNEGHEQGVFQAAEAEMITIFLNSVIRKQRTS